MGKGSGGQSTNTVVQNSQPPAAVLAQYQNVQSQANQASKNPYYYYPGQLVAGLSPAQSGAIADTQNIAGALENPANTYGQLAPFLNSGSTMLSTGAGLLGGTLGNLSALENPANTYGQALPFINAASQLTAQGSSPISAGEINNYMNPYLQQVGQTTMAEMQQNNAIQQQQLLGSAAASGALGGNRVGLAQSALANQQDLAANATLANINAQGYNTALGAAQTTAGQQLQGGFLMGQTGQLAENAALTGLSAPISEAGALAQGYGNLGTSMAGLGSTAEGGALQALQGGLTGAGAQLTAGSAAQQQQQNELNAAYQQWLGGVQYPFQNVQFLSNIAGGLGSLSGGSSSTQYPSPAVGSQILGGLTGTAALLGGLSKAGMFGAGGLGGLLGIGASAAPTVTSMMGPIFGAAAFAKRGGAIRYDQGGSVKPQDEIGDGSGVVGYLNSAPPSIHGAGPPQPPPANGTTPPWEHSDSQLAGFSSIPDLSKYIGKELSAKPQSDARGGVIHRDSGGGVEVPTPMDEQILDYQMVGQLAPGSQVRKISYQPPAGVYAAGGSAGMGPRGGMDGQVSSMPLVGAQGGLSAPNAGLFLPDTASPIRVPQAGGIAVPQAGGLSIPNVAAPTFTAPQTGAISIPTQATQAQFAPVQIPGTGQSVPMSGSYGTPSGYIDMVHGQQAVAQYNADLANAQAAAAAAKNAPPPPTQAPNDDAASVMFGPQNKRGGRIRRADGGDAVDPNAVDAAALGVPPGAIVAPSLPDQESQAPASTALTHSGLAAAPTVPPNTSLPASPQSGLGAPSKPSGDQQSGLGAVAPPPRVASSAPVPLDHNGIVQVGGDQAYQPSSVRNNNPLNLNYVPGQPGLDPNAPTDGRFARFLTQQDGVAAATRQLLMYRDRGINTVGSIIGTWAPSAENGQTSTANYIAHVSSALGVKPDQPLDLSNPDTMARLEQAMWQVESPKSAPDPRALAGGVEIGYQLARAPRGTQYAQAGMTDAGYGTPTAGLSTLPGTPQWFAATQPEVFGTLGQAQQPIQQTPVPPTTMQERLAESPWMALAKAGFGMMAGTSPFAGVNIGRGMLAGTQALDQIHAEQLRRQGLQFQSGNQNVRNVLAQREQALRSAELATHYGNAGTHAFAGFPAIQQGEITSGAVPGVTNPITGRTGTPMMPQAPSASANDPIVASPYGPLPLSQAQIMATRAQNAGGAPGAAAASFLSNLASERAANRLTTADGQVIPYPGAMQTAATLSASTNQVKAASNQVARMQEEVPAVQAVKQNLTELVDAAEKAGPNAAAGMDQGLARSALAVAHQIGLPVNGDLTQYASNADVIHKLSTTLATQAATMAGQQAYASLATQLSAVPTMHLSSKQAYDTVARSLAQFTQLKADLAGYAPQANAYIQAHPSNPQGWLQEFQASHPAAMYASRVTPIQTAVKGNQVIAPAGGLRAGYNYQVGGNVYQWTGSTWAPTDKLGNAEQ